MGDFPHPLLILYQNFQHLSSFFCDSNSEIGKGIEPHPTDGHQCYYASLDLSNDIETHGASTISPPAMPCGSSRFASPLSTQHNYYIKTSTICQVFFNLFLFFLNPHTHPFLCGFQREPTPSGPLSKTIGKMVSELPPASSVTSSPYS